MARARQIKKACPRLELARFPSKSIRTKSTGATSQQFLERRRAALEAFVQDIVARPEAMELLFVQGFLRLSTGPGLEGAPAAPRLVPRPVPLAARRPLTASAHRAPVQGLWAAPEGHHRAPQEPGLLHPAGARALLRLPHTALYASEPASTLRAAADRVCVWQGSTRRASSASRPRPRTCRRRGSASTKVGGGCLWGGVASHRSTDSCGAASQGTRSRSTTTRTHRTLRPASSSSSCASCPTAC